MTGWNLTGGTAYFGARGRAGGSLPWEQGVPAGPVEAREGVEAPGGEGDGPLSVTQAVQLASGTLDALPAITVLGEVSGFRGPYGARGHCYFQVKDESSSMECIIWGGTYKASPYELRNGLKMRFTGKFSVYQRTGKMSFQISRFEPVGEGLLRQQVAALAEKLRREGLMDEARKRPIPAFCTRVAVVTSLSGAVIDDVKRTLRRRNPLVELVCVGSKVQGEGAEAELIAALGRAAALDPAPDCILLVRGGGSFEDLMTFNDEALARAVAASPVPVVTGIGHEPDTSICDMVSDRRCSTPTAAAESVAPAASDLAALLDARSDRLVAAMDARLHRARERLDALAARPCLTHPDALVRDRARDLEQTADRLVAAQDRVLERLREALSRLVLTLPAPAAMLAERRHELDLAARRLEASGIGLVEGRRSVLGARAAALDALSPLKVLGRGYGIAYRNGSVATSAASFAAGDALRVAFADGAVWGTVEGADASGDPFHLQGGPQPGPGIRKE